MYGMVWYVMVPSGVPDRLGQEYVPDTSRLVITGHSMWGHGCLVFS